MKEDVEKLIFAKTSVLVCLVRKKFEVEEEIEKLMGEIKMLMGELGE